MRVQVALQEAEITRGFQRMYAQAGVGRNRLSLYLLALGITIAICVSFIALFQKQDFYKSLSFATEKSGGMVCFAVIYFLIYAFLARYAPKQKYFGADGLLRSPREISIDIEGVHQTCRYANSFTRWIGIRKIEEDAEFIFLYVDVISCYLIPKRCFPDPAEASAFVAQAKDLWSLKKTSTDQPAAHSPWGARSAPETGQSQ